jgi:hypothetical protein
MLNLQKTHTKDGSALGAIATRQLLPLALGCLFFFLILKFGNRHFGGFDHSLLVDAGYRLWSGQNPYRDFFVTTPLIFHYGVGWAFKAFGLQWNSLVLAFALFSTLHWFWHLWLLSYWKRISWAQILAIAGLIQIVCSIYVSYWWYNPLTNLTATTFALNTYALHRSSNSKGQLVHRRRRRLWLSYFFALLTLSWCKPNIAGPLILIASLALLIDPQTRRACLLATASAFFVSLGALYALEASPFTVLSSYFSASGRAWPSFARFRQDKQLPELIRSWLLVLLPIIGLGIRLYKQLKWSDLLRPQYWIFWTSIAFGFLAFFVNGETKLTDFPLYFIGIVALWTQLTAPPARSFARQVAWSLSIAGFFLLTAQWSFSWAQSRWRVRAIGNGAFWEGGELRSTIKSPFFRGFWHSESFEALNQEISETLQELSVTDRASPEPSVFFGPRIEFGYAAYGLPSPKGFPIFWWYEPSVSMPTAEVDPAVERFKKYQFKLCIFLAGDPGYVPPAILEYLKANYIKTDRRMTMVFRPIGSP